MGNIYVEDPQYIIISKHCVILDKYIPLFVIKQIIFYKSKFVLMESDHLNSLWALLYLEM